MLQSQGSHRSIEHLLPDRRTFVLESLKVKTRVIIDLEKKLPIQGGLGGASSNAVATLLALERALKKSLPAAERLRISAEVGSDLPLFLVGGAVLPASAAASRSIPYPISLQPLASS